MGDDSRSANITRFLLVGYFIKRSKMNVFVIGSSGSLGNISILKKSSCLEVRNP